MTAVTERHLHIRRNLTSYMLADLGIPPHRIGYKILCVAIPQFALDDSQSLTKELYPALAEYFGYTTWQPVEHAIREVISDAWEHGNRAGWELYFPSFDKAPSNKAFISALAKFLE